MKTILITGATDGIGLALAKAYATLGTRLVLVGRRPLATLTDPLFTDSSYCQIDLADEHCTAELSSWLHEQSIRELDLVIHNAAIGYVGAIAAQPLDQLRDLIHINLWAPIVLSHMLFPLVARARGKMAFVTSVATAFPGPTYATYTATKVALEGFVRSWQVELAAEQSPVRLQIVRPGATRTNMHAKSGTDPAKLRTTRFPSAEQVATAIIKALTTEQRVTTIGGVNRLIHRAATLSGDLVDLAMQRRGASARRKTHTPAAKRHCVITGAADGIGRALAEAFAAAGYMITGIDVDADRSNEVQHALAANGTDVHFIQADLAASDRLPEVVTALAARPPIDVLIHNAGISAVGAFTESNIARQRAVLEINFSAPLLLTALLLREQRMAPAATFVFLSSLSRFMSYPGATVYAATKDGIASYARSLAVAVAPEQHHVVTVYPGPTRTAHARRYSPDNRREAQRMAPATLAQLILKSVQGKRRTLIPGIANRAAALLGKLCPPIGEQLMRRTIYERLPRQK